MIAPPARFPFARFLGLTALVTLLPASHLLADGSFASVEHRTRHGAALPRAGDHRLDLLSPRFLALRLITSRQPGERPALADWVNEEKGIPNDKFPKKEYLRVAVNGTTWPIGQLAFYRNVYHAPLEGDTFLLENRLFLSLDKELPPGARVEVSNPDGRLFPNALVFQGNLRDDRWSDAVHVSQAGYQQGTSKRATVSYWLGRMGELPIPSTVFRILDRKSGQEQFKGKLNRRKDLGFTHHPLPYQEVLEADFSSFDRAGDYVLQVPGIGLSFPYRIDPGIDAAYARHDAAGLYHQRSGATKERPFTRFEDPAGHLAPAAVPDDEKAFKYLWKYIKGASKNARKTHPRHTAPLLSSPAKQLFPFRSKRPVDVRGGHMDAGDYSKYTINTALTTHALFLAVDYFPRVADLDNLGLPESGDGVSDLLQEAIIEADFLARLQDSDGGFYYMVMPRERRYELDKLPSEGDPQVVLPKNTAGTAAAVAALAEAGSSPELRRHDPARATAYLGAARRGWEFLQGAIRKHGRDGAYQTIAHYGDRFMHDDELAWAAAALFVATGESHYQTQLLEWLPDPEAPELLVWDWWRLFEGYGAAFRTYTLDHFFPHRKA
ncbi:MAG: glycoside hydrolase family 9 protein, partial [Verrucomicrobiota bacterium]